jgi:hypothetical protein
VLVEHDPVAALFEFLRTQAGRRLLRPAAFLESIMKIAETLNQLQQEREHLSAAIASLAPLAARQSPNAPEKRRRGEPPGSKKKSRVTDSPE